MRATSARIAARMALAAFVLASPAIAATQASAAPSPWSIVSSTAPVVSDLAGISCPSATTCFGIGQTDGGATVVRTTSDGGRQWSTAATLPGTVDPQDVFCPSTSFCLAVDQANPDLVVTTNGWSSFTVERLPLTVASITDVSCLGEVCAAVGSATSGAEAFLTSQADGRRWTARLVPGLLPEVNPFVACSTTLRCTVGGAYVYQVNANVFELRPTVDHTANGGRTWSRAELPRGGAQLAGASCTSSTRCYGVGASARGAAILLTTDGGESWRVDLQLSSTAELASISCASGARCVAVGFSDVPNLAAPAPLLVLRTVSGGLHWTERGLGMALDGATNVSCGGPLTCVFSALFEPAMVEVTHDGGITWSDEDVATIPAVPELVACPADGTCEALGVESSVGGGIEGFAERTTDDGASWQTQSLPLGVEPTTLTCPSASTCFATAYDLLSGREVFVSTTDGGTNWTATSPSGWEFAASMSCPTVTYCAVLGGTATAEDLYTTDDGGATWVAVGLPDPLDGSSGATAYEGVSCVSDTTCELAGIELSVSAFSFAEVGTFATTTDGGTAWDTYSLPGNGEFDTSDWAQALSCATASVCVATGDTPLIGAAASSLFQTSDAGAVWNEEAVLGAQLATLTNPSCTPSGWCTFLANGPDAAYSLTSADGGQTWTLGTMPAGWTASYSVSCSSAAHCMAIGELADGGIGIAAIG